MSKIQFKGYKVEELNLVNKITATTKMELKNGYSYNVRYTNHNLCEGKFTVTIVNKENPEIFSIKLILNGIFTFEPEAERETIHVQTYKELFPYARAIITTVTANAGIQPIMLPDMNIENREIYRFDNPNKLQ